MLNNLTMNEFKNGLIAALPRHLAKDVEVVEEKVEKANRSLHGLIFRYPESPVAPALYVEDLYESYRDGQEIEDIAMEIADIVDYSRDIADGFETDFSQDLTWSSVKDRLRLRLIGTERNGKFLEDTPHQDVGPGLALIATVVGSDANSNDYSATVNAGILKELDISEEALFEEAVKVDSKKDPASLTSMQATMNPFERPENLLAFEGSEVPARLRDTVYILSNNEACYGAKVLFRPGFMEKASKLIGGSYYVIPSSVHELLLLPASVAPAPSELLQMVAEANGNSNIVSESDFLATAVYFYDSEGEVFSKVAG